MILENIKALCEKHGITTYELERKLGFGRNTIRKWNTVSPTVSNLQAVAKFFHVKIDTLVKGPVIK